MERIVWESRLAIGIEAIDRQHQKLLSLLNDVIDIINTSKSLNNLEEVLHGMVTYAKAHFGAEESLMQLAGYPELEEHKGKHKIFVLKILEINQDYNPYSPKMRSSLLSFLNHWYLNHIGEVDRLYVSCLRQLTPGEINEVVEHFDPPEKPTEDAPAEEGSTEDLPWEEG